MKTIGLIGGLSWHSSARYYEMLNSEVANRLGSGRSAKVILFSLDYGAVLTARKQRKWAHLGSLLIDAAQSLERAGAEIIAVACNSVHLFAADISNAVGIPFLHIADPISEIAKRQQMKLGLLGTRFTMSHGFYQQRLRGFGIEVETPTYEEQLELDRIIAEELVLGQITEVSRNFYLAVIDNLSAAGCDAIVLACTEIAHLELDDKAVLPLLDTAKAHTDALLSWSLAARE